MAIQDALMQDPNEIGPPKPEPAPQGPPKPTQVEENKSRWRNYLAKLEDPNVKQAVIAIGLGLMRTPQFGQGNADVIANALGSGVQTLQGLRQMDRQRQEKATERADTLAYRKTQTGLAERGLTLQEKTAQQRAEDEATQAGIQTGQLSETQRHNLSTEEIARRNAESDRIRAKAYSGAGNRTAAEIQKINMLAAQYQVEGMDEVSARARAVMYVESTGAAKSPGEQAQKLFEAKLKNWQGDLNNFGKSLTREQVAQMQQDAINEVVRFQQFNQQATGTPQSEPGNPRAGVIDRSGAGPGTPVGTTKQFGGKAPGTYKKTKAGPDSDMGTWTKVTNGNTK